MSRARAILFLVFFMLFLPLLFAQFLHWQAALVAADTMTNGSATNIGVVADTTESMGPELTSFSNAWQNFDFSHNQSAIQSSVGTGLIEPATHCDPFCPPLTATFRLVSFNDTVQYRGSTPSYGAFGQSLSSLKAEGGAGCPDNALGGLLTMAKNLPTNKTLASDVVLVTDATPFGNRPNYAFVVNKMLRRGVNVHSLVSSWCPGAPIPEAALQFLTQATGGQYYQPLTAADYYTETLIVQDKLFATDLLLSQDGSVSSGTPDTVPLTIDSLMYGVSVEVNYTGCLTCPFAAPAQSPPELHAAANPNVQIELRDPDGTLVDTTTEGFDELNSSSRQLLRLYPPLTSTLKPGAWEIRVSGQGSYNVSVAAQSGFHFAYLGPGTIPLSQPSFLRVALGQTDGNMILPPLTATFKLIPYDAVGPAQPVNLYDDGQHNDGAAGDGIYGGMVQPAAAGWHRLSAEGELNSGMSFQRLAEVPLHVQQYRATGSGSATATPDTTQLITFTVQNQTSSGPGALSSNDVAAAATTTFELGLFSEQGWTITSTVPATVTLAPGETYVVTASVVIPANAAAGVVEESTFVAVDVNDIDAGLAAVVETTVANNSTYLPVVLK